MASRPVLVLEAERLRHLMQGFLPHEVPAGIRLVCAMRPTYRT
jgi:hypothetical protein